MNLKENLFNSLSAVCSLINPNLDTSIHSPSSAPATATEGSTETNAPVSHPRYPPVECDGYPPVLCPEFLKEGDQVDFYLPNHSRTSSTNNANKEEELACSLIRHVNDGSAESRAVKGPSFSFDIDSSKPVIILCHGFMSWRNQMLLVFLAAHLSRSLKCHTLRFDFSGNGNSSGQFLYGDYDGEQLDLREVIGFVRETMGCTVACLIGHSKGAQAVLRYAWEHNHDTDNNIPTFVNLSGRFSVPNDYDVRSRLTKIQFHTLEHQGKVSLGMRSHRTLEISKEDVAVRMGLDSLLVKDIRGAVLTIHGGKDEAVDVSNAHKFAECIPRHELHIIEKADHNFNGLRFLDDLVSTIASFVRTNVNGREDSTHSSSKDDTDS